MFRSIRILHSWYFSASMNKTLECIKSETCGVTFVLWIQSISQILINSLSLTERDSVTVQHHFSALFASFVTHIPFLRVSYFLYLLFSLWQVSTFVIGVKIRVQMTRSIANSTFMISRNYLNNNFWYGKLSKCTICFGELFHSTFWQKIRDIKTKCFVNFSIEVSCYLAKYLLPKRQDLFIVHCNQKLLFRKT